MSGFFAKHVGHMRFKFYNKCPQFFLALTLDSIESFIVVLMEEATSAPAARKWLELARAHCTSARGRPLPRGSTQQYGRGGSGTLGRGQQRPALATGRSEPLPAMAKVGKLGMSPELGALLASAPVSRA
jgi:hypothetical protein